MCSGNHDFFSEKIKTKQNKTKEKILLLMSNLIKTEKHTKFFQTEKVPALLKIVEIDSFLLNC